MTRPHRIQPLTILLIAFVILLAGCNQGPTFEHEIQVQAADTGNPISGAEVKARMGTRDEVEAISNANGKAQLFIKEEYRDAWVKVTVSADEYQSQSLLVKLVAENPTTVVQLNRPGTEPQPAAAEPNPTEADQETTSNNQATPPPNNDSAAANGQSKNSTKALTDVPPAERANYYQAKPELVVDPNQNYQATIHTGKGDIIVSLDAQAAPEHVNNFIFLANEGFYDGLTFHRVEPGFVIQGGDPLGSGQGGPGYTIPGEFKLKHGEGALAMARLPDDVNPNRESSGSQFYITLAPTPFLDGQYSVFGQVEEGMDVVRAIEIGDVIEGITIEP